MPQPAERAFKHGAAALSVFDVREAVQLKPAVLERAGRLAATLRASGFEEAKVKQVLRALFCTHLLGPREAEQQMERAFDVWDDQHTGVLELKSISHELSAMLAAAWGYSVHGPAFLGPKLGRRGCQACADPFFRTWDDQVL